MFSVDQLIGELDRALRAVAGVARSSRPSPGEGVPESELDAEERAQAAALMRVNHVGEVCAQALYQGQSLTARNEQAKSALLKAANEEEDHLAWSADRIRARRPAQLAQSLVVRRLIRDRGGGWRARRQVESGVSRRNRASGRRASFRSSRGAPRGGPAYALGRRGDARRRGEAPRHRNSARSGRASVRSKAGDALRFEGDDHRRLPDLAC